MPARIHFPCARSAALACAALLLLSGCSRMKDSINANSDMRKGAVDNARKSCVQSATAKLPNASPQLTAKIDTYCDCFATRGLEKFSNTELMEVGLSGGKMTPEIKAKLNSAVQMCIGTLQTPDTPQK